MQLKTDKQDAICSGLTGCLTVSEYLQFLVDTFNRSKGGDLPSYFPDLCAYCAVSDKEVVEITSRKFIFLFKYVNYRRREETVCIAPWHQVVYEGRVSEDAAWMIKHLKRLSKSKKSCVDDSLTCDRLIVEVNEKKRSVLFKWES